MIDNIVYRACINSGNDVKFYLASIENAWKFRSYHHRMILGNLRNIDSTPNAYGNYSMVEIHPLLRGIL